MSFRIHFQDLPHSDSVKDSCEKQSQDLGKEFPETERFEVTVTHNGELHRAHLRVTGKHLSVNASADHRELQNAVNDTFHKAHNQLRKHHDKTIFTRRRRQ